MRKSIEATIEEIVQPIVDAKNFEIVDIEYVKEAGEYYLRVYLDKEGGISLIDCEVVSRELSEILDKKDPIKDNYFLEVSSPGVERILRKEKHLSKNKGQEINISLFKKDENGKKEYKGILEDFDETTLKIKQDDNEIKIDRKNIAQIKTVYNW